MGNSNLAEEAISLARITIANWLDGNNAGIIARLQSKPVVFPVFGGSLVEGLMTCGSDLDFCMLMDNHGKRQDMGRLQLGFKRSMSKLDDQLKQLGLRGLCRISRRIRNANEFLELYRCHESRAAMMRTGVKLNYILSCRLLDIETDEIKSSVRLAAEPELLRLKKRLYRSYCKTVGYSYIPILPYLLKRPSSYTPRRVITQVQLAVNNILLATYGIDAISGTLDAKISRVVDIAERERTSMERDVTKDDMNTAIDLIRNIKCRASADKSLHQKSLHHLISKGDVQKAEWECVRRLTEYLLGLAKHM